MSIALTYIILSLASYRAEDFLTASATKDFTTLGTCVGSLTDKQLKTLQYDESSPDCTDSLTEGIKANLIASLSVSVHGAYYTYHGTPAARLDPGDHLAVVLGAMVNHVLGKSEVFYPTGLNQINGVNFSQGYAALNLVSQQKIPVSCDEIYGRTFAEITADADLTKFIKDIRESRLDDDKNIKSTWPLVDIVANCNGRPTTEGVEVAPFPNENIYTALTANQIKYMHAHCTAQFQFASVGTTQNIFSPTGTGGIPYPGIKAGPFFLPYLNADGFNSTSSYNMKARMYLGQRFGLSVWAYIPMILATCFLLGDAIVFMATELTMPYAIADQGNFEGSRINKVRDSLVLLATSKSSRQKRLAIGITAVFFSFLFYFVFIVLPWGFVYTVMPRPICEESAAPGTLGSTGIAPDHNAMWAEWWQGSMGGWKSDWDATYYDLVVLILQLSVLLVLPFTTFGYGKEWNNFINPETQADRNTQNIVAEQITEVQNNKKYMEQQYYFIPPIIAGVAIMIIGQSVSGARFGMAWAEGVVAQETDADGILVFNEVALSKTVYDQTVATAMIAASCGLLFSAILQRHLIGGVGCYSSLIFFLWVGLVVLFAAPILYFASERSILSEDASSEDCAAFPRSSHEFSNDLCVSRFWTFLVGFILFAVGIGIITLFGCFEAFPNLLKSRIKQYIKIPPREENGVNLFNTAPRGINTVYDPKEFFHPKGKPAPMAAPFMPIIAHRA